MSYEIVGFDKQRHRLQLEVRHSSGGMRGTTITTDVEVHLSPNTVDPSERVSALTIDVRWVHAESVPALANELARVLERLALGLREGPGGMMALLSMAPETAPVACEDG